MEDHSIGFRLCWCAEDDPTTSATYIVRHQPSRKRVDLHLVIGEVTAIFLPVNITTVARRKVYRALVRVPSDAVRMSGNGKVRCGAYSRPGQGKPRTLPFGEPHSGGTVLATQGSASRASTGLNQWSLFIRMTRQFAWEGSGGQEDLDRYTLEQIPIVGIVEGFVRIQTREGILPATGVAVSVDDARFSLTDENGHYRLANVPEAITESGWRWTNCLRISNLGRLGRTSTLS